MMGVQGLIGISMGVSWTMLWLLGVALLIVATTEHLDEGHVKELSCGHLFYRTFHLDPKRSVLYVGAMDRVLRLNLNNINQTNCKGDSAFLQATNVAGCVSRGKSEDYDCRNHIRVIQPMGDGSRLYICGTNAHNPKDWVLYSNLTHLAREVHIPGIGNGVAKCPFDPSDNSTAVWVEHGNPGGLPGLYSGTVAEFTKADTVIFRTDLFDPRLNNGKPEFTFKRTVKYDSKWLDKPNFVGSYEIGEYVYFFFRETAVEYINCGKNIYSRVARVCKRDTGGKNVLHQNWATYLKARLNCSIPGEFPFYFNEIQGIYKLRGDNTTFYAVFTTSMNGLMGSAICTYTIEDIQTAFLGRFKEQSSSSSAWLPVLSSLVPEPRPGECVNDTRTLPDTVLNFIRSHPLMDEAVAQKNGRPVFYKRDLIFTHLVVDKVWTDANGKRHEYTVYFVGSHEGRVYKIVEWFNREIGSQSRLLDMFQATTPHPIRAMEISPEHKSIYVSSDYQMHQLSVEMCTGRYESCVRCVQDPYCGWDATNHVCKPYRSGHVQDVSGSVPGICQTHAHHENIEVNWGQSLHLGCTIKMSELLDYRDVTWFRHSRDKRILITPSRDKYVMTSDHGLVILGVSEEDMGRYDCVTGGVSLCRYNVSVNNHRCTAPDKVQDYQRIYSDWCQQFDKYKMALKSWQSRQLQCGLQHNKTYDKTNLLA